MEGNSLRLKKTSHALFKVRLNYTSASTLHQCYVKAVSRLTYINNDTLVNTSKRFASIIELEPKIHLQALSVNGPLKVKAVWLTTPIFVSEACRVKTEKYLHTNLP